MSRSSAGRPRSEPEFDETQTINRWLDQNIEERTDLTAEQIASKLNYSRPQIISMWRTGRTRIPLDKLAALADILKVEVVALLPMWLAQYATGKEAKQITAAASRMVSEAEAEFLSRIRTITGQRRFKLKKGAEKQFKALLDFE